MTTSSRSNATAQKANLSPFRIRGPLGLGPWLLVIASACAQNDSDSPRVVGVDGASGPRAPGGPATSDAGAGGNHGGGGRSIDGGGSTGGGSGGGSGIEPVGGSGGSGPAAWCSHGTDEICEDNFDNNCDGEVDEGCVCRAAQKPCYPGDPTDLESSDTACRAGVQSCKLEFYGPCEGFVLPNPEACDGIDNDCNGRIDDLPGCNNDPPVAICPPDQSGPPLANYHFVGNYEDPEGDEMTRAQWRIIDAPVGSTAETDPPNGLETTIFADLQGTFVLELEVEDVNGGIGRCTTRLVARGSDGLRVEMVWNIGAGRDTSDVDLHLLRRPGAQWFQDGNTGDDCFFRNCRLCAESYGIEGVEYEELCRRRIAEYNNDPNQEPPPQVEWTPPLSDDDPRLDLDDVQGNGPENINIRTPEGGRTYRLGVHYWTDDGFGDSSVVVRIFCAGELAKEFEPLVLHARPGQGGHDGTEFWEVANILWRNGACQIDELGQPGCRQICTRGEVEHGGCPNNQIRGRPCP